MNSNILLSLILFDYFIITCFFDFFTILGKKRENFLFSLYSTTVTGKYLTPHANASACEFIYTSILFPWIAPPLSSTVYVYPPISNCVPNENWLDVATVLPAVAFVPDAVIPFVLPQHFAQEQYAVTLNILVSPTLFPVVCVLSYPALDVVTIFFCTCTILSIGSFIISSERTIFSICSSFWYFVLYVTSFIPSFPSFKTLLVVFESALVEFFVIVSYGIATCSTTIFSVIGA